VISTASEEETALLVEIPPGIASTLTKLSSGTLTPIIAADRER
jgi:hypothetical protein